MKTQTRQSWQLSIVLLVLLWQCATPVLSQESGSGTITLFVYPPSDRMEYSRPGKLLRKTMAVELKRILYSRRRVPFNSRFDGLQALKAPYLSTIGHTICRIDCTLPDGAPYEHWASLSGKDYTPEALRLLLREGAGLGVLFHNFEGGFILGKDENLQRLIWYQGYKVEEGRVEPRYIQFPVLPEQCADIKAMVDFFEQFHADTGFMAATPELPAEERALYFTNMIDPYESYISRTQLGHGMIGGGCAPFGVALLKAGHLYDPALDTYWKRPLTISERLIGRSGVRRVSLLSILFGRSGRSWEHEGYANCHLQLYDPSMIWQFIVDTEKEFRPLLKSGTAGVEAISNQTYLHASGFVARQGMPIVLPVPEFIGHHKYPRRPGRTLVEGIVLEVKTVGGVE